MPDVNCLAGVARPLRARQKRLKPNQKFLNALRNHHLQPRTNPAAARRRRRTGNEPEKANQLPPI
jgi:hypothetical protein